MQDARTIRAGFIDSEKVNSLSWMEECVFHRLLLAVDEYGRIDARPAYLRSRLFGLKLSQMREADLQRALRSCERAGLVRLYDCDRKPYLEVLNWQRTAPKTRIPAPPDVIEIPHTPPQNAMDTPPTAHAVEAFMKSCPSCALCAEELAICAAKFHASNEACGWLNRYGLPIRDWRPLARAYLQQWAFRAKSPRTAPINRIDSMPKATNNNF